MAGAFLHVNLVQGAASVTCATASDSAGVSNLLDPQPRLRLRGVGGAAILVDFGGTFTPDCVALISTNATAAALVRVRLSTADVTGLAGDAWDTGTVSAQASAEGNGNVVVVRATGGAGGRYLLVELADGTLPYVDVGYLAVGALWRLSRAQSYGFREGRLILDQRPRNPVTGAEFPVPAVFNPRFAAFQVAWMNRTETEGNHRILVRRLGAVGDALWIPETDLSQAELNNRSIWGAAAQPGEDAGPERPAFQGWTRSWRLVERG